MKKNMIPSIDVSWDVEILGPNNGSVGREGSKFSDLVGTPEKSRKHVNSGMFFHKSGRSLLFAQLAPSLRFKLL